MKMLNNNIATESTEFTERGLSNLSINPNSVFSVYSVAKRFIREIRIIRVIRVQGFTLVEIIVVVALFVIMLGAIYAAFGSGRVSYYTQETQVAVQQETRKAITRMTKELRQAGSVTISTTLTANDTITFQIPTGFDANGNIIWSSNIQYNRGGLNNSQIIRTQAAQTEVLANDISTLAFSSPATDLVTINVTASKLSVPTQINMASSQTARVQLRN